MTLNTRFPLPPPLNDTGIKDVSTIDTGAIQERVGQIANYMALHASSVLNSMDNITVMILLLYGGPTQLPAAATEGTLTSLYDLSQSHRTSIGSSFTKNNKIASTHNGGDKISQQPAVPGSSTNPAPVTLAGNPTNAPTAAFERVGGRVQQQQQSPQSKLLANSFTQDEIDVLKSLSSAADEGQGDRKRTDQTGTEVPGNLILRMYILTHILPTILLSLPPSLQRVKVKPLFFTTFILYHKHTDVSYSAFKFV